MEGGEPGVDRRCKCGKSGKTIDNKAKAISAELLELNFNVQLYNPAFFMTNIVIFRTNSSQNLKKPLEKPLNP